MLSFKSDYLFASDAVKVHKLYRHIGEEGQKKIKQWKLNLDEITLDQLFEHLDEECKPGGSVYRSRSDLWHNTKQGNMTLDDFYNKIERLCDLCSFSPEEHKAFHRDAFLLNLSNQGTTQWVIEQLSKENPNPSHFSPQYIKNLAKTIEQNRATRTIFVHQCKHWCKCLSTYSTISKHKWPKRSTKSQKAAKNATSRINNSSWHNPTKRVILCGKTTRAIRIPSQIMIAHDVVILSTKISPDAPPADTSVRSAQG